MKLKKNFRFSPICEIIVSFKCSYILIEFGIHTFMIFLRTKVNQAKLGTFELWVLGLMLYLLFSLISRLNNTCSPLVINLQINYHFRIKDIFNHVRVGLKTHSRGILNFSAKSSLLNIPAECAKCIGFCKQDSDWLNFRLFPGYMQATKTKRSSINQNNNNSSSEYYNEC